MTSFDAIFLRDQLLIHLHVNSEGSVMNCRHVAYVYLLYLTARKRHQCQYQINIAALQCGVVKIHKIEILAFTFSQSNPIIYALHIVLGCSAARLWQCLFSLAAP